MSNPTEEPGALFDGYAGGYDDALQQGLAVSGENKEFFARGRVLWLKRRLAELGHSPRSILDFGCGTGSSTPFFHEILAPHEVVGVDVSERSVAVARQTHGPEHPNTRFEVIAEFAPTNHFDLAFCNGVFHHIPVHQRAAAVAYVVRALKPGGLFAFWENNPWNPGTRYVMSRIPFDRDAITLSPPTARRLLREAGLQVLHHDFLFLFPRALSWLRPLETWVVRWPMGAQYLVLGRRPASDPR